MQRIATQRDMGGNTTLYRVRIEGDDCEVDSVMAERMKLMLLENIVSNPSIVQCGTVPFQIFKMYHNGERWIVEVEATARM